MPLVGVIGFMIIGFAGVLSDYGRAQVAQSRLQSALDAAALAAAKHIPKPNIAKTEVRKYFDANFNNLMSANLVNFTANVVNGDQLNVTAVAEIDTVIMQIFGTEKMTIEGSSGVQMGGESVEIVFVLDNTGSMDAENMPVLKTSMRDFINDVFDDPFMNQNLEMGIVPFANAVNIETTRPTWIEAENFHWGPVVWSGCVAARWKNGRDTTDDPPSVQKYMKHYWPCYDDKEFADPNAGSHPNMWYGTDPAGKNCQIGPGMTYQAGLGEDLGPLRDCEALQPIVPMVNQKAPLLKTVNAMDGVGSTQITTGLSWGWNMLSPRWRGVWGGYMNAKNLPKDYNFDKTTKHLVLVSDGANILFTAYSAYGPIGDANLGTTNRDAGQDEVDRRTLILCDKIKANNIRLYTIALGKDIVPRATDTLKKCATSLDDFYESPADGLVLTNIFKDIKDTVSAEMQTLRLVR